MSCDPITYTVATGKQFELNPYSGGVLPASVVTAASHDGMPEYLKWELPASRIKRNKPIPLSWAALGVTKAEWDDLAKQLRLP